MNRHEETSKRRVDNLDGSSFGRQRPTFSLSEVNLMGRWLTREEGQGMVEYGLIIALVAIVVITVLLALGPAIGNIFSSIITAI